MGQAQVVTVRKIWGPSNRESQNGTLSYSLEGNDTNSAAPPFAEVHDIHCRPFRPLSTV